MFEPVRYTSAAFTPLMPTVRLPPAVTRAVPFVESTRSRVSASLSTTVMSPAAVATRLAAARLRSIEPVAVAETASAETRPLPEMLPAVALRNTSSPAVTLLPIATLAPVSVMSPTATSVPSTVSSPAAVAERLPPRFSPPTSMAPAVALSVMSEPEMVVPLKVSVEPMRVND